MDKHEVTRASLGPESAISGPDDELMTMNDYLKERQDGLEDWKQKNSELLSKLKNSVIKQSCLKKQQDVRSPKYYLGFKGKDDILATINIYKPLEIKVNDTSQSPTRLHRSLNS